MLAWAAGRGVQAAGRAPGERACIRMGLVTAEPERARRAAGQAKERTCCCWPVDRRLSNAGDEARDARCCRCARIGGLDRRRGVLLLRR